MKIDIEAHTHRAAFTSRIGVLDNDGEPVPCVTMVNTDACMLTCVAGLYTWLPQNPFRVVWLETLTIVTEEQARQYECEPLWSPAQGTV